MDDKRRAQIKQVVDIFRGKKPTATEIDKVCKKLRIDTITPNMLQDYTAQVVHDEVVSSLFKEILKEIQHMEYVPEFAPEKTRKELFAKNDEVRVNITKLFEKHAIEYKFVSVLSEELGRQIGATIEMAGTTAFNKALQVMLHLAREKFGGEFNMGHAEKYAREVFEKAEKKTKKA